MKITVDAMGGDNAPQEIVKGAVLAVNELGVELILTGKKDVIEKELSKYEFEKDKIEIINAEEVVENEDKPVQAIRKKKNSSMVLGLKTVKDGQSGAFVSAGNTGALLAGGTFVVGRIKGVKRPCLAPGLPNRNGGLTLIADAGANVDCRAEFLAQFARMGSIYARDVLGKENPRIALANLGVEEEKGNELTKETYPLLQNMENLNFIGNIEPRSVIDDEADVIVSDGFTGNTMLKTAEGVAKTLMLLIKDSVMSSFKSKVGGLLIKDSLKSMKKRFDYTEYGGAPLLGVKGGVIKAHGSSDANAIKNAIRQAKLYIDNKVTENIENAITTDLDKNESNNGTEK